MSKNVEREIADSYLVRNQGEWARIFLQEGVRESGDHWGYIAVISGYGNFGHCFSNVGKRGLREFLLGVGFDYLMGKFLGAELHQFDADATLKELREYVLKERRSQELDAETAREVWDSLQTAEENGYTSSEGFLTSLSHTCHRVFYELELWSRTETKPNPQAVGFWEEIWPVFCKQLRAELAEKLAA